MDFQYLSDVHTGRNAQRIQDDIQRCAVGQERHILLRKDTGNNTLVTMASGHLVTDRNFSLLSDIAADYHVDTRRKFVGVFTGKDLDIHHNTIFAVGNTEGGIPNLSRLLAKDSAEQAFFGGKLCLSLGGNLTHQNISGAHLGANPNDTHVVKIFKGILAYVGNIPGDFLRPELGVSGLDFIFFNVDGCKHIIPYNFFIDEDCVLVVVTLPGHKADENIFTQADLAVAGSRAVSDDLAYLDTLTAVHNGTLVGAGALVRAEELNQVVGMQFSVVGADDYFVGGNTLHHAVVFGKHHNAGIHGSLILHASAYDGGLGFEKRHSLPLHVGAHQSAVGVVVFQEGDHGCRHRDNHFGGNIHEVYPLPLYLDNLITVTGINSGSRKASIFVNRLVSLGDNIIILHIGGHIDYLVQDDAGFLIHPAIRRFYKAVFIDLCKGCKIGDQTDVRTFWGLNGAHTAIVAVVHVTDLKSGTVTGKTARAQRGKTALMGQFRQGVGLIHKLGKGRRSEELLDGGHHRADIDQRLGGDDIHILGLDGHPLTDNALHSGKTNAELVLQKLTHAADTAVTQMVDVVDFAHFHRQIVDIVDRSKNICFNNMFRNKVISPGDDHIIQCVAFQVLLQDLLDYAETDLFIDAQCLGIHIGEIVV